jgi:hypothetical protein
MVLPDTDNVFVHATRWLIENFDTRLNVSFNQVEAAARQTFSFGKEYHPYGNLMSGPSIALYQWVMSLRDQPAPYQDKLRLLETFRRNLLSQHYPLGVPADAEQRFKYSPPLEEWPEPLPAVAATQARAPHGPQTGPTPAVAPSQSAGRSTVVQAEPQAKSKVPWKDPAVVAAIVGGIALIIAALIQSGVFK